MTNRGRPAKNTLLTEEEKKELRKQYYQNFKMRLMNGTSKVSKETNEEDRKAKLSNYNKEYYLKHKEHMKQIIKETPYYQSKLKKPILNQS